MTDISEQIQARLFELRDEVYHDFQCKLMPNIDPETVIGVRVPLLRKYAKELSKIPDIKEFLLDLPHRYYDENNLHGFIISLIKDYDSAVEEIERFLPYVNNWATCDLLSPKVFAKNTDRLYEKIKLWLFSEETYTVRFAIEMLMSFYLDDNFDIKYAEAVASVKPADYYVNMMIAWYFATALAKHYDEILPFISERRLDRWIHNKTISKACDSYRITDDRKAELKSHRIK